MPRAAARPAAFGLAALALLLAAAPAAAARRSLLEAGKAAELPKKLVASCRAFISGSLEEQWYARRPPRAPPRPPARPPRAPLAPLAVRRRAQFAAADLAAGG